MTDKTGYEKLEEAVKSQMSEKRFRHTAGVIKAAGELAALYCPDKTEQLKTAALLHDLTKEWTTERQLQYCQDRGIPLSETDRESPKVLHGMTAAVFYAECFPELKDDALTGMIRWHTTGRAGMTLEEKLIYLADYIEETRTWPSCVLVREAFYGPDPAAMTKEMRLVHLDRVMLYSYDLTIKELLEDGNPIGSDTVAARNELLILLRRLDQREKLQN